MANADWFLLGIAIGYIVAVSICSIEQWLKRKREEMENERG